MMGGGLSPAFPYGADFIGELMPRAVRKRSRHERAATERQGYVWNGMKRKV